MDFGEYPPGDGNGSRDLILCLERKGRKRAPYFEFAPDMKTLGGHVISPLWPDGTPPSHIVHYRNNLKSPVGPGQPPVRHPKGVDLWAADGKGNPWGINNWD